MAQCFLLICLKTYKIVCFSFPLLTSSSTNIISTIMWHKFCSLVSWGSFILSIFLLTLVQGQCSVCQHALEERQGTTLGRSNRHTKTHSHRKQDLIITVKIMHLFLIKLHFAQRGVKDLNWNEAQTFLFLSDSLHVTVKRVGSNTFVAVPAENTCGIILIVILLETAEEIIFQSRAYEL